MARCRSYLRGLAVCVTVLLLASGVVMIGVGFSSIDGNTPVAVLFDQLSSSDGLLVLQVFGPITVLLSVLGVCAASVDLKPLLLVFSSLVFVEFVALMVVASPLVQVQAQMDGAVDEVFLNVTPLHRAERYIQSELNKLQASDSCCGLKSFEDWENQLPVSCLCTPSSRPGNWSSEFRPCVTVGSDLYPPTPQVTDTWVHSEPCGPILKSYLSFPIKLRIGIISAFATIAMAAIALCLTLGLEDYWKTPPVETTVDDYNRVKYQPKPSLT
ncbi:putative 23 kDa integral membrane protein-like isoform 2 [Scophthalmus maximus]|uniref:Putative 23 kDa integral membrane protein-like isoform 2 n=1 Tax=Scophthalmus maximus TaxID=52904 RepID=A0A2U9B2Z8_SCOMX|nr:putative 23 kDa integral membrane protein-like isoform 2 [Scophthalmus maximus]